MLKRLVRTGLAICALPLLAACSETSVMDAFDAGKSTPDENLVSTNRPLSMPPDMALRQPGAANAPAPSNGLSVEQGQRGLATYQAPPPPQPSYQPPAAQQPAWQNSTPSPAPEPAPQQQAYAPSAPAPQVSTVKPQDKIYYDNGINPYNADGTRKTQSILNEALRQKSLETKRAENPNYGTIFNMGEVWSGN